MSAVHEPISTSLPDIVLRPIAPTDMEFLYRLYRTTRLEELVRTGWDEAAQEAFVRQQFQAQHSHYQEHYAGARFDVIERHAAPVGRQYVYRGTDEIILMEITLLPEWRNRGIGGGLTRELTQEARAQGKRVVLHVEPENPAKRLYERLGFVDVAPEGPFYIRMHFQPGPSEPARGRPS
jgi:ribosomal protein S18 acetylase RimI-like enzyme